MEAQHTILIAEDHTMVREGMKALLSAHPQFSIVGEAEDGYQAVQAVAKLMPDLVLMDLSLPRMHGVEAIREIKKHHPQTKVLVLTVHRNEAHISAALKAGADGYVLKHASYSELVLALESVLSGRQFVSPAISGILIEGYLEGKKAHTGDTCWDALTPREREILKLIAEGYKNHEIADLLSISIKTVDKHRTSLMSKLDLHNVSALTAFAMRQGLIPE